jgi:hypothetical protein
MARNSSLARLARRLLAPLFADVAEHQHRADDALLIVADRRGAVVDRRLASVARQQQRLVDQSDDLPLA